MTKGNTVSEQQRKPKSGDKGCNTGNRRNEVDSSDPSGVLRCPHCRRMIAPQSGQTAPAVCPHCRLAIDEVHLA